MVVALFAALIVPWFVNWNDYRASFEAEASRLLGHRVHVEGDAHAIILPSPSLTFTNVEVDDEAGGRLMDVARFDVVIELMPLLQGEIRVVSMTLEKPVVDVSVDASGKVAWLSRVKLREPFDPDRIVLDNITIKDGALNYSDAKSGVAFAFDGISAEVTARSLTGPWHVDGFYLDNGSQVGFRISTGRVLDDGTLRVKADVNPARWPVTVGIDGPVGIDPAEGLTWQGTYSVAEVATGGGDSGTAGVAADGPTGWRSEGAFALTGDRLDVSKAVLSNGPVDRPLSLAGSLTLSFGKSPSFAATAEARQIDLDRTLGKGPSQPVDVAVATDRLVAWLRDLPVPAMPGSIRLNVPTIVVGGRIIENVAFTAAPAKGGWQIGSLTATLPGQATVEASGLMTTSQKFGFVGDAHLVVAQPATFATWWRGDSQEGAGRLLAPFDLSGRTDIGPGHIALDHITARIDDATITGSFSWAGQSKDDRRDLYADLDATRIDFVQLKALGELLVGRNLTNAASLADGYNLHVKADAFVFQDLTIKGIEVNAKYGDDALTVTALRIADIGGARIERTSGKIDSLSADPRGHLDATLDAHTLTGLAGLAGRFLPQSGFTRWLDSAAPSLGEAVVTAKVTAPLPDGGSGFAFTIDNGVAASTAFNLAARFTGGFTHWRTKPAEIKATLDSPDSAGMARQLGLAAVTLERDNGGHIEVQARGIPAEGLDAVVVADLAGLVANASGKVTVAEDLAPSFDGTVGITADDVDPIVAMAGLDIPGTALNLALALDGQLSVSGNSLELKWKNGKIGETIAGGDVTLAPDGERGWRIGGAVQADRVDLGWIASLGLGFAPLPTGDPAEPWSHETFAAPAYGQVNGKLQVSADRLDVGTLGITGTTFTLALQPQRIDVDLTAGQLAGGTVIGGMSVHNVGGNANFTGRFDLKGAALESFVWRRDARSVATGSLDLSANFEATGGSPAGLVSTMTGGGVIAVHDGLARYVNPNAVRQIVRASDLGQQYSEDALKSAFGERIDADNLSFKEASGAFAIVAGAVRLKGLMVKSEGLAASGNAVIDFNAMTLDSDWDLAFDPVDNKVQGAQPEAGIVFHGPIAEPSRSLDVLQFAAYLNEREAARMTEIIALDAATRSEKERLNRLVERLKGDALQRAEDARIAAEREAKRLADAKARAAILEAFHANREIAAERRHVATLTAFAESLAARQKQADAAAADAQQVAKAARAEADTADKALADARQAEDAAAAKAESAAAALATAKTAAEKAVQDASQRADLADQQKQARADAIAAERTAKSTADGAAQSRAEAEAALKAAMERAAAAESAANGANALAASTASEKERADKAAAAAVAARDAASADLAQAEVAVKAAQAIADAAASQAMTLGGGENAAETAKAKADADAKAASDALASAKAAHNDAAAKLDQAKQAAAAAEKAAESAASMEKMAKTAAELAQILAGDGDGADADAIANAENQQKSAESAARQAAAKRTLSDAANAAVTDAQTALDQAAAVLPDAEKRSADATAAAAVAGEVVKRASASADEAASNKDAAAATLEDAVKARDAAKATLAEKDVAVAETAVAATSAARAAADATGAVDHAEADRKAALAEKAAAGETLTQGSGVADTTAKAAQAATEKRIAADRDAKAAEDRATAAASTSDTAARTLAARREANDAAQAAFAGAVQARQTAEAGASSTEAKAQASEAIAKTRSAEAADAATAAEAARRKAEQAAQGLTSGGPIVFPSPANPDAADAATSGSSIATQPDAPKPASGSRQKGAPMLILPSGELTITAPTY